MPQAPDIAVDNAARSRMSGRELLTFVLLILMYVFMMADSRLMSAIMPELSQEYGVSRQTLGLVGTAFVLSGAVMALLVGVWCDRWPRKKLLVLTVIVGEIPCLLTGIEWFTSSFAAFTILRLLTGIGMGGIGPVTYSLVADYFREEHRAKASAGITVAWAVGILMGPSLAGYLTDSHGWRIAFILAAAPNFPLALLFAYVAKEPKRGARDAARAPGKRPLRKAGDWRRVLDNRINLAMFLQGLFGAIPWGVTGFWAIYYFEEAGGMSKAGATSLQNLVGLGAIAGTVVFGVIGDRLYRRRPSHVPLMCGTGILLGIVPFVLLFHCAIDSTAFATLLVIALVAGFTAACAGANVKAILMNNNEPEQRGSVFGLLAITESIGPGLGPLLGAMFFDWWGMRAGMNFAIAWWIPCGIAFLSCAFLFRGRQRRTRTCSPQPAASAATACEPRPSIDRGSPARAPT
jgi:MFS family permease